jgi:hypothetical protein
MAAEEGRGYLISDASHSPGPTSLSVPHGSAWADRAGANRLLRPRSCNLYNKVILEGGDDHQGTEAQAVQ